MPVILAGRTWTARQVRNNNLRQHCHALARCFRNPQLKVLRKICTRLFTILETRSRVFLDLHPRHLGLVEAVIRLGAYEAQWIRPPEDWHPVADGNQTAEDEWADFLRHLLAQYPVPRFLDSAWFAKGALEHFERDCWCAVGWGRSLREVNGFPPRLSNRVLHQALYHTQEVTLPAALIRAQLEAAKAPPALQQEVMASDAVTELGRFDLWQRLIEKFATDTGAQAAHFATVSQALVIVQDQEGPAQMENLIRLPLAVLIQHSQNRLALLLRSHGCLMTAEAIQKAARKRELIRQAKTCWPPMLGSESLEPGKSDSSGSTLWRMEELCSLRELQDEGRVMHHCVAGYTRRCKQGTSAIFSLRKRRTVEGEDDEVTSYVTIEVHPRKRKMVQIRAFKNRPVNGACMNLISQWARSNGLE